MGVLSPASITEKVVAAVKSTTSLSLLNSGQAMIIALGTLFVMLLAVPAFLRHPVRCSLVCLRLIVARAGQASYGRRNDRW